MPTNYVPPVVPPTTFTPPPIPDITDILSGVVSGVTAHIDSGIAFTITIGLALIALAFIQYLFVQSTKAASLASDRTKPPGPRAFYSGGKLVRSGWVYNVPAGNWFYHKVTDYTTFDEDGYKTHSSSSEMSYQDYQANRPVYNNYSRKRYSNQRYYRNSNSGGGF